MEQNIKQFIEEGEKEFNLNFTSDNWCSCGGEYDSSGGRRKVMDWHSSRQISLIKMIVEEAIKRCEGEKFDFDDSTLGDIEKQSYYSNNVGIDKCIEHLSTLRDEL